MIVQPSQSHKNRCPSPSKRLRPLRAFTRVSAKHAEWQAIDMEGGAPVVHDFSEANADFRAVGELAKFIGEQWPKRNEWGRWLITWSNSDASYLQVSQHPLICKLFATRFSRSHPLASFATAPIRSSWRN